MNYVEDVIRIAQAEIGYVEKATKDQLDDKTANAGSRNYTKYARDIDNIPDFYNGRKQGYSWCDVFVDWCFIQAYGAEEAKKLLCQPDKSCGAGCYYSMIYYKGKKQLFDTPQVGDQIFFTDSEGDIAHTGLVIGVDDKKVYTIEGNTSSVAGMVGNGGCVRDKSYDLTYKYIAGYGRPNYDVKPEPVEETVEITLSNETLKALVKAISEDKEATICLKKNGGKLQA